MMELPHMILILLFLNIYKNMISLHEAKVEFSKRKLKLLDFYDKHDFVPVVSFSDDHEELIQRKNFLERQCESFGKMSYSNPHIRPYIKAWMVDIKFGDEIDKYFQADFNLDHLYYNGIQELRKRKFLNNGEITLKGMWFYINYYSKEYSDFHEIPECPISCTSQIM